MKAASVLDAYNSMPPEEVKKFRRAIGVDEKPTSLPSNQETTEWLIKRISNK